MFEKKPFLMSQKKMEEHGIHCLPYSHKNDVLDYQHNNYDVILMSEVRTLVDILLRGLVKHLLIP